MKPDAASHIYREIPVSFSWQKYSVTVLVGGVGHAFCTCRDFWEGAHGKAGFNVCIWYSGATVDHGCAHVDFAVDKFGWTPQPTDTWAEKGAVMDGLLYGATPSERTGALLQWLETAYRQGLEMGRSLK